MGCSHTRAKVRLADERIEGFSPHRELSLFIPKSLHHFRINVYKVIQWDKSNGAFVLDFIDFSLILLIIAFKRNPLLSLNDVYNRFQSWSISIYILFCNRYKVNKKKKKTSFLFAVETNKWRFHLLAALKSSLRRNQVLKIYCIFDARPCDADISAILLVKFERRSSLPPLSKTPRISPRPVRDPLLRLEINLLCIDVPMICNLDIASTYTRRKFKAKKKYEHRLKSLRIVFWIVRREKRMINWRLFCYSFFNVCYRYARKENVVEENSFTIVKRTRHFFEE